METDTLSTPKWEGIVHPTQFPKVTSSLLFGTKHKNRQKAVRSYELSNSQIQKTSQMTVFSLMEGDTPAVLQCGSPKPQLAQQSSKELPSPTNTIGDGNRTQQRTKITL